MTMPATLAEPRPTAARVAPRRIALAITELEVGGAEQAFTELALGLDRQRFEPQVYCLGRCPSGARGALAQRLEASGTRVHYLGHARTWSAWRAYGQLRRLLQAQRPDLLQTFLFHANLLGRMAAWRAGVPNVVSGIRVAERRASHLWAERLTRRLVRRHVCVSRSVADYHAVTVGLAEGAIRVIPNGIEGRKFRDAAAVDFESLGLPAGRRWMISVGRLERQKGLDLLLAGARELFAELPEWDLLLVGTGHEERSLRRRATALGLEKRVHFLGWREDVPGLLRAAHLLVLPSRWEGLPNVVLEGMAAGLPVAAFAVEGVAELLGPQSALQVAPPGNVHALIETIVHLALNPAEAAELGRENQRRACEQFSWSQMVAGYEALYDELLAAQDVMRSVGVG